MLPPSLASLSPPTLLSCVFCTCPLLSLRYLNYAFAFVFLAEAALKICAYHLDYFADDWNKFDLSIVVGSIIGLGMKLSGQVHLSSALRTRA